MEVFSKYSNKVRLRNRFILVLFACWLARPMTAQKAFETNNQGKVISTGFDKFCKERGYEVISFFDTVSHNPVLVYALVYKNSKYGVIDIYGNEIFKPEYELIPGMEYHTRTMQSGYPNNFIIVKNEKYGVMTNKGKELISPTFERLGYQVVDSVLYCEKISNDKYELLYYNMKGERISYTPKEYPPMEGREYKRDKEPYKKGAFYFIELDDTTYKIPNLGKIVSKHTYSKKLILEDENTHKQGVYDLKKNKLVVPLEYDQVTVNHGANHYKIKNNNKYGLADANGNLQIPIEYAHINYVSTGFCVYKTNDSMAIFNEELRQLTAFNISAFSQIGDSLFIINQAGKFGAINYFGEILIPFQHDYIRKLGRKDNSIYIVTNQGKKQVLDLNYQPITPMTFDEIIPGSLVSSDAHSISEVLYGKMYQPDNNFFIQVNGKWGVLDSKFNLIIDTIYNKMAKGGTPNCLHVQKDGKWGVYNLKTKEVIIPLIYQSQLSDLGNNFLLAFQEDRYGLFNNLGEQIVPFIHRTPYRISSYQNGFYQCYDYSNTSFLIDGYNNLTYIK